MKTFIVKVKTKDGDKELRIPARDEDHAERMVELYGVPVIEVRAVA